MSNYFLNTFRQTIDVNFLILSSVNNHLHIYVFASGVDCKVTGVGSTELNNVSYISAKVTCAISFKNKKSLGAQIKDLDAQISGGEQISNLKQRRLR